MPQMSSVGGMYSVHIYMAVCIVNPGWYSHSPRIQDQLWDRQRLGPVEEVTQCVCVCVGACLSGWEVTETLKAPGQLPDKLSVVPHFHRASELGDSKHFCNQSNLRRESADSEAGKVGTNSDKITTSSRKPDCLNNDEQQRKPSLVSDELMLVPCFLISVFFLNGSYI